MAVISITGMWIAGVPHLPDARPQVFSYSTWGLFAKLSGRAVMQAWPPLLWWACLKLAAPNGAAFFSAGAKGAMRKTTTQLMIFHASCGSPQTYDGVPPIYL